jgi:hypothetical protein
MIHGQLLGSHFAVAIIADALLDLSIPPVGNSQAPSLFFFPSDRFRFDFMFLNGHIRRPRGLVSTSMMMVKKRDEANARVANLEKLLARQLPSKVAQKSSTLKQIRILLCFPLHQILNEFYGHLIGMVQTTDDYLKKVFGNIRVFFNDFR